jgi:hypothetical protein
MPDLLYPPLERAQTYPGTYSRVRTMFLEERGRHDRQLRARNVLANRCVQRIADLTRNCASGLMLHPDVFPVGRAHLTLQDLPMCLHYQGTRNRICGIRLRISSRRFIHCALPGSNIPHRILLAMVMRFRRARLPVRRAWRGSCLRR